MNKTLDNKKSFKKRFLVHAAIGLVALLGVMAITLLFLSMGIDLNNTYDSLSSLVVLLDNTGAKIGLFFFRIIIFSLIAFVINFYKNKEKNKYKTKVIYITFVFLFVLNEMLGVSK